MRNILVFLAFIGALAVVSAQIQAPPSSTAPASITPASPISGSGQVIAPFLAFGALPAQTGVIRLSNATDIMARNAANSADISLIRATNTDVVRLGNTSSPSVNVNTTNGTLCLNGTDMCFARVAAAEYSLSSLAFAALGTPANGTFAYCSDCTIANPCAGGGTGAFAKRLNGVWICN